MPDTSPVNRTSFADVHGWGWDALRKTISAVPWLGPRADKAATMAAWRAVGSAVGTITDWSVTHGAELPRAVRNIVAEAPPDDHPLWRLLISVERAWPTDNYEEVAAILPLLPETTTPGSRVLAALLDGASFSASDFTEFLGCQSPKAFERSVGHRLRDAGTLTAAELAEEALSHSYGMSDRQRLQLVKRAAHFYPPTSPLTLAEARELPTEDIDLLLRWPHLIRILEGLGTAPDDGRVEKSRIEPSDLAYDLRGWRDQRRKEVLEGAISALAVRDYGAEALRELALDETYGPVARAYHSRFKAAIGAQTDCTTPAESVAWASSIAEQLPDALGLACQIALSSSRDRAGALASSKEPVRIEAIRLLHPSELVATLASADLDREAARSLIEDITSAGRAAPVLSAITGLGASKISAPIPAIPAHVYADWLEVTGARAAQRQVLVERGLNYIRPSAQTLQALVSADLTSMPSADVLALLLPANMSSAMRDEDPERWERLYGTVATVAAGTGWLEPAPSLGDSVTILDAAIGSFPRPALSRLADDGSLLDPDVAARVPLEVLLDWLDDDQAAERFIGITQRASREGSQLPSLLREAAVQRPALLSSAMALDPALVPLQQLIEAGLDSREAAAAVDANVPAAERWAALPWVRERYADQPGRAVAHELAVAFGLSYAGYLRHLARLVKLPVPPGEQGRQFDGLYRTYELPKKRGGNRTITVPHKALRGLQRAILVNGFEAVPLHPAAKGFRRGLSIRDNAMPHTGKELVVNIDITSFFPSTPYLAVLRACRQLCGGQLSPAAVHLVADICMYDGGLPIGAPTSPAIANVVLRGVDAALATVAKRRGVSYTRYADDLTFSGGDDALTLIPFARRLLLELGYRLDRNKTNVYRRGRRQLVTGLVVNEHADLSRRTRRRLRAALHRRENGGAPEWHGRPMDDAALTGWLAFGAMLRPEEGARSLARMRSVSKKRS